MPMTDAEFANRIRQKPVADPARVSDSMPTDGHGHISVRVRNRLVPLMPLGTNKLPAGASAPAEHPRLAAIGVPAAVDHTFDQTPVRDQVDRPTCVAFAVLAALEALVKRRHDGLEINLSEQFAYWLCMSSEGKTQCDQGLFTVAAANCLHRHGVCEETLCPYETAERVKAACATKPDALAFQQATFGLGSFTPLYNRGLSGWSVGNTDLLESLLAQDLDIVVGFEGIFGMTDPSSGILDIFRDGNGNPWPAQAGHSMLAVGYTRDPVNSYFLFKNSWPDPTGSGYMKVSYDYLRQYATCGVVPRQVRTNMPVNGAGNGGVGGNG